MKKVTSFKKLSKKKQRELNLKNRRGWGDASPVTRVVKNKKHYNRKRKTRVETDDFTCESFLLKTETVDF